MPSLPGPKADAATDEPRTEDRQRPNGSSFAADSIFKFVGGMAYSEVLHRTWHF